jgi:putative membrane protein
VSEEPAATPLRTDPRTFAVRAASLVGQLVLPIIVGGFAILDRGDFDDVIVYFLPLVIVAIGLNLLFAYLRWSRLTYTVGAADIRVDSGVLSRSARSVPYERIQDVSLEQKLLPRLFGLVEVKFETGAGGGDDLKLAYVPESEGERLRELARSRREGIGAAPVDGAATPLPEESARLLFAMSPSRVVTFGLFEFSLAVVAVAAGLAQQFDFILPFEVWDWRAWREQLAGPGQWHHCGRVAGADRCSDRCDQDGPARMEFPARTYRQGPSAPARAAYPDRPRHARAPGSGATDQDRFPAPPVRLAHAQGR